jgi:hypothetical protein
LKALPGFYEAACPSVALDVAKWRQNIESNDIWPNAIVVKSGVDKDVMTCWQSHELFSIQISMEQQDLKM